MVVFIRAADLREMAVLVAVAQERLMELLLHLERLTLAVVVALVGMAQTLALVALAALA